MKKYICLLVFILNAVSAFAQTAFPALSNAQKQKLLQTKIAVPLPTWIPSGFLVTNIVTKTGSSVKTQDKVLSITYGKKLADGHSITIKIEAGFDGRGDLPYDGGESVKSKAGNIYFYYEPTIEDTEGRKLKYTGLILTEWFTVNHLDFQVEFNIPPGEQRVGRTVPKISKAEARKILQSMQVLK